MPANSKQKLKILYIMKILLEKSDENHMITVNDIIDELEAYGVSAERKSVYTDIDLLISFGLDIICEKGRANMYFVGSREFELPELKLLVDVVQVAKFITHKKSYDLIKKLEKLTSTYEAKELHRQVIVNDRVKIENENIYYNVDAIQTAIKLKKKVEFKYFEYTVEKSIDYRYNGYTYSVNPFALTWANDNYYLITFNDKYKNITHYRVDRMDDVKVSECDRVEPDNIESFNVAEYTNKVFGMFSGDTSKVVLRFSNSLINVVIDRFGKDVFIRNKTEETFDISIDVVGSSTFYGWLFMFGTSVEIIEPADIREAFSKYLDDVQALYKSR